MSNPYTFYIEENLMAVVYASTRDEATRIFLESLKEHDKQIREETIDECIKAITDYCGGLPNNNLISVLEQLEEK